MAYRITRFPDLLGRITLTPPQDGFQDFICSWILNGEETFLVDPGPAVTSPDLLTALEEIGLKRPDYILLTHIHIDHAGGIGEIATAFPETPVVCHRSARPHLINPERLWQGTLKTLGETGRAYGPISPVPEKQLLSVEDLSAATIKPILTPGHAPHHVSYLTPDGILFVGEAGGVNIDFEGNGEYLRPATPPRFDLETSIASLDRLLAARPETICYGHTSLKTEADQWLRSHREQLFFWKDEIRYEIMKDTAPGLAERCADRICKRDRLLGALPKLPAPVFRRERFFIENSIRGFIGYLSAAPDC
ncbi:MAG: MBL fold metallo-hydrolase [Desulfosudaceae bacterium]